MQCSMYPYQFAAFPQRHEVTHRAIQAPPDGVFQQMALTPVTDDSYLVELLPELDNYHEKIVGQTFDIDIAMPPQPMQQMAVPVSVMINVTVFQSFQPTPSHTNPPVPERSYHGVSVQNAIWKTGAIQHHSSILFNSLRSYIENVPEACPTDVISDLRVIKGHLQEVSILLEKVLLFHTFNESVGRPSIETVRNATNQINDMLNAMKRDELHKLFPPRLRIAITPAHVLCNIVGLSEVFTGYFLNIPPEEQSHQSDLYLITQLLEDTHCPIDDNDTTEDDEDFLAVAFTESKKQILGNILENNPLKTRQPILYWAKRFVKDTFEYDILLNDSVKPFKSLRAEKWLVQTGGRVHDKTEVSVQHSIPVIYATNKDDVHKFEAHPVEDGYTVFFHGTDDFSARHIVENGIMLANGSPEQDFSDGFGFYLSKDFASANNWARYGNFSPHAAVIAFKVSNNVLDKHRVMDISSNEQDWQAVVKYNRSGRDRRLFKIPADTRKLYESVDLVEGPVLESVEGLPQCAQVQLQTGSSIQTCIVSERMATIVGDIRNISVCFIDKASAY